MSEMRPVNLWNFQSHPEWQETFDNNGTIAAHERHLLSPVIIDPVKLSADALRLNQYVVGRRDLGESA